MWLKNCRLQFTMSKALYKIQKYQLQGLLVFIFCKSSFIKIVYNYVAAKKVPFDVLVKVKERALR